MGVVASLLGYVLNFIYNLVQNYGWAIIIFSVLLRLIILPFTIKQQKTMKKTAKVQKEMQSIQAKYKNDPEKLNRETIELYRREKVSPFSGCLSGILQLVVFLSVFYLVSRPLTYMKNLDKVKYGEQSVVEENVINQEENIVENNEIEQNTINVENVDNSNLSVVEYYQEDLKKNNNGQRSSYVEIEIINKYREQDDRVNINMNFLGLDLSKIPMQNLNDFKVYIIPLLYIVTTFINIKLSMALTQNNKKKDADEKKVSKDGEESTEDQLESMQQMTNSMNYMMPIMSIAIAIIAPLGLSLYWFISNSLQLLERVIINRIFKEKEEA